MPVLVLDGHSRAAIETAQSLGRAALEVDVAAESLACVVMRSRYPEKKLLQPQPLPPAGLQQWLRDLDGERKYELIVPATETSLLALRFLDESDPLRRKAVLPGNEALDTALDKLKTWHLARQLGVSVPETVLLSREKPSTPPARYPIVIKPVRSKIAVDGQLQTVAAEVIRDHDAYTRHIEQWLPYSDLLWQEFIFGQGVGAEFLFDRGNKVWHFVHERVHEVPLSGGASSYRRSVPPMPELLADAERILSALHWHGVAMVEFRVDAAGQHWLIEINPRLWGSLALAIDAGVDFPLGLWLLATGRDVPLQPAYRKHYYTRDLSQDVEWFKDRLRAAGRDSLLPQRSIFVSAIEMFRPLVGRESWDHFDFHDLALTRILLKDLVVEHARLLWGKVWPGASRESGDRLIG
ncbi:MAG TPA: ATP-grasp domain-containing protein [Candidatus Angelobacter sp.]|nr:ATP-grasp domain-containing protein [Candidatus Angelobacter sp.]